MAVVSRHSDQYMTPEPTQTGEVTQAGTKLPSGAGAGYATGSRKPSAASSPSTGLRSVVARIVRDDKARLVLLLAVLWAAIGYLDLVDFAFRRAYPVSVLYFLVMFPAAAVFGNTGLLISTVAVVVMFHFTNDKSGLSSYTENEVLRLGFAALVGFAFAKVGRDREQIRTALRRLQRETKVREDLTHMLVHDLRTPLTGIITGMQTLQMGVLGDLDPDQQELVDFAVVDGQRMLEMVNQILDVAKLEAGEMQIRAEDVDLAQVAANACRQIKPLADDSAISVICDNAELVARADPDLIKRVMQNLIGNAVKFTPRNGTISVTVSPAPETSARIVVSDTGWGIPKADLVRIFDKYAQSKGASKAGPSSGLGLTFCRLAVEAHGGRIWAESEVGKGTQMNVLLPLEPVPATSTSA